MKPSHAAALALVGWYVMAPPVHSVTSSMDEWDASAPLAKWEIVGSFDTAAECRHDLFRRLNEKIPSTTSPGPMSREAANQAAAKYVNAFLCVASDDPRLAK